jgi:hypothetical protein
MIGVSDRVAFEDRWVTKPLPVVSLPNRFEYTKIGPKFGSVTMSTTAPFLQNFQPPGYMPDARTVQGGQVFSQSMSSDLPQQCPMVPIRYRNEWETMNTNNAKAFGGFDKYSVMDVPSCSDRSGGNLNWNDYTDPFVVGYTNPRSIPVIWGGHTNDMPVPTEGVLSYREYALGMK